MTDSTNTETTPSVEEVTTPTVDTTEAPEATTESTSDGKEDAQPSPTESGGSSTTLPEGHISIISFVPWLVQSTQGKAFLQPKDINILYTLFTWEALRDRQDTRIENDSELHLSIDRVTEMTQRYYNQNHRHLYRNIANI